MASLILLIVLAVYCIWLLRHMAKRRKEKHGNVWTVLIRGLECADKSCILPKQKNSFPE